MAWKIFKLDQEAHTSQYFEERSFPHGDRGILYLSRFQGAGDAYRIYMSFDIKERLSEKKAVLPRPAFLRLFLHRNEIVSGALQCSLNLILEPWRSGLLNWNYQPSCAPGLNFVIPGRWQGFMLLDLSQQVREWLEGSRPNYGFMIKGDEHKDSLVAFHGASYPFPGTAPVLLLGSR